MRIVVTGAGGQLATDLSLLLARDAGAAPATLSGWQQLSIDELDLTDAAAVRAVVLDQARAG